MKNGQKLNNDWQTPLLQSKKNSQSMTACGLGWIENQKGIAFWKKYIG